MTAPAAFTEQVTMNVVTDIGQQATLPVDLCWDPTAHLEIQMILRNGGAEIEWVVGRHLLADGLAKPSGDMDLRITPDPAGLFVHIALTNGKDSAVLVARYDDLAFFLGRTIADTPMDAPVDVPDPDDPVWAARG